MVVESRFAVDQRRPRQLFDLAPCAREVRDAKDEGLRIEWLNRVIPRAGAKGGDMLRTGSVGRDDNDRRDESDLTRLAERGAEIDRIGVFEIVTDDDDVGRRLLDELERSK